MTRIERMVVLGASNAWRGLPSLVQAIRQRAGGPVDLLFAAGYGRSYGMRTRVLGKSRPGILASGLWPTLRERPRAATAALVTDVGNDILYGAPAGIVVGWVAEAVRRLAEAGGRIVITGLPVAAIADLGPLRYLAVRTLLFPGSRIPLTDARSRALEIHEGLRDLATRYEAAFVEPEGAWYGLDPIHVRRSERERAWTALLDPLGRAASTPTEKLSRRALARLDDGTRIALY